MEGAADQAARVAADSNGFLEPAKRDDGDGDDGGDAEHAGEASEASHPVLGAWPRRRLFA